MNKNFSTRLSPIVLLQVAYAVGMVSCKASLDQVAMLPASTNFEFDIS